MPLVEVNEHGLWCEPGGFHIDPWKPVAKALITHGHADHARNGSDAFFCASPCAAVLRERFGPGAVIEAMP